MVVTFTECNARSKIILVSTSNEYKVQVDSIFFHKISQQIYIYIFLISCGFPFLDFQSFKVLYSLQLGTKKYMTPSDGTTVNLMRPVVELKAGRALQRPNLYLTQNISNFAITFSSNTLVNLFLCLPNHCFHH